MADSSEFEISMVLIGPPRLRGRWAAYATRLQEDYQLLVADIAEWYEGEVKRRFAERHGQSGETEESIHTEFNLLARDQFQIAVRVGGHVGFVINHLPGHWEFVQHAPALGNFDPTGDAVGRTKNFYSPFGAVEAVYWKQGKAGGESHSPDTEWFEGENSALVAKASRELHKLAGYVQLAWGEATSGRAVYTRAAARSQYTYYRNR